MNSVEKLKQEKLFLSSGESFAVQYDLEIGNLLTALFGTPTEPRWPVVFPQDDGFSRIVNPEKLQTAGGLFLRHCAHCHGATGDGAGPTARSLEPYPRDFRLGKFKFKSTPLRSPPTDEDLRQILLRGVPGTAMPSFRNLPPGEINALIDYVKFLSIRGQFERYLWAELVHLDAGEPLIGDGDQAFEDAMFALVAEGLGETVMERWVDRASNVTDVPMAPADFWADDPGHFELKQEGRKLFHGLGNCAQCHGQTGVGNGLQESFDDWTTDWTKTPGVNPFVPGSYLDFTAAGALPPRPSQPRNLTRGLFRGGDQPERIYLRVANGIEGTPMPSAPALKPDQIWALVAYVMALPQDTDRRFNNSNRHARGRMP